MAIERRVRAARLFALAAEQKRVAEHRVRDHERRIDLQRLFRLRHRFVGRAATQRHVRQRVVRVRLRRRQVDVLLQRRLRLVDVAALRLGPRQEVVGGRIFRVELDGVRVVGDRAVEIAERALPELPARHQRARIARQRAHQLVVRLLRVGGARLHHRAIRLDEQLLAARRALRQLGRARQLLVGHVRRIRLRQQIVRERERVFLGQRLAALLARDVEMIIVERVGARRSPAAPLPSSASPASVAPAAAPGGVADGYCCCGGG